MFCFQTTQNVWIWFSYIYLAWWFLPEIFDSWSMPRPKINRCNVEWVEKVLVLTYPTIPNSPHPNPSFEVRGLRVSSPILPSSIELAQQACPLKSGSSYFRGSICWLRDEAFKGYLLNRSSTLKGKGIIPSLSKRNLLSLVYPLLIGGGSACLFLRQTSGPWCNVASWKCDF